MCFTVDAVAGPDEHDATLRQQSFQPLKKLSECPKDTRKITIGLPEVSRVFPRIRMKVITAVFLS